jgi:hypothetical protein
MIELTANAVIVTGMDAAEVIDLSVFALAEGDPAEDDFEFADLETVRDWAIETVIIQAQVMRRDYLTPGKEIVYEQKQREVRRYDAGERTPALLPYMMRRSIRLSQTLQQVRDMWQSRIVAVRNSDLEVEDAYEIAIEMINDAVSVDEITTALAIFLSLLTL